MKFSSLSVLTTLFIVRVFAGDHGKHHSDYDVTSTTIATITETLDESSSMETGMMSSSEIFVTSVSQSVGTSIELPVESSSETLNQIPLESTIEMPVESTAEETEFAEETTEIVVTETEQTTTTIIECSNSNKSCTSIVPPTVIMSTFEGAGSRLAVGFVLGICGLLLL